jgi:hypothetical protein
MGSLPRLHHRVAMLNRRLLGTFSFAVTVLAFELAFQLLGTPRAVGPVVALVLAVLIILDPGDLLAPAGDRPGDRHSLSTLFARPA